MVARTPAATRAGRPAGIVGGRLNDEGVHEVVFALAAIEFGRGVEVLVRADLLLDDDVDAEFFVCDSVDDSSEVRS